MGNLQAYIRYIWQVNDPLSQVSNLSTQIQSAFAALERIVEMLEEEEEVKEAEHPKQGSTRVQDGVTLSRCSLVMERRRSSKT